MRYVMFFAGSGDMAEVPEGARNQVYAEIGQWWEKHSSAGKLVGGEELQPATTATTIRFEGDGTVVTDGPFVESKEQVGGYGVLDVDDLDEAISIARTWPARGIVEIRPVVTHD